MRVKVKLTNPCSRWPHVNFAVMKNKFRVNAQILVAAISLSLAGIIGLQAYLFRSAIIVRDAHFKSEAAEALQSAVRRIENLESQRFLTRTFSGTSVVDSRPRFWLDSIIVFNHSSDGQSSVADTFITGKSGHTQGIMLKADSSRITTFTVEQSAIYKLYMENKLRYMDTLMRQMLFREIKNSLPVEQRFSFIEIDSLLRQELEQRGIQLSFEFAITEGDQITSLQTAGFDINSADFRVPLFRNDFFESPKWLFITFPERVNYLLQSMWVMLALSGLFTAFIIIAFAYTVNQMQKQKKISLIKSDFISNMTHEFKTPIATINLAIDALSNPRISNDPAKIDHYKNVIREENKRMHAQVEKVLQLAMLDKQELQLHREVIDMHNLIETAINSLQMQLDRNGVNLITQLESLQTSVLADEVHMTNVLVNIIDNAMKYGGSNQEIRIETRNEHNFIHISITDNGPGMSKEVMEKIFDRFYREIQGNIHDVKGHGLGLSYVKEIVEMHQGTIIVKSIPGVGSTFIIQVPTINTHI